MRTGIAFNSRCSRQTTFPPNLTFQDCKLREKTQGSLARYDRNNSHERAHDDDGEKSKSKHKSDTKCKRTEATCLSQK